MKIKLLICEHDDTFTVVRIYFEEHFEQAQKDYEMMSYYAENDYRHWDLIEVDDVYILKK